MRQPQFNPYEFVSDTIFTTAFSQVLQSIREPLGGSVYFVPGVANPSSLTYTYNGNLTVTVNAPSPFKCLFEAGQYSGAHGITNGVDSSTYTADFTSIVPVSGTVTGYIVATYATVQEDPVVIVGPPPGHPDYNSSFVPYLAYTRLQDTLSIYTTTTVPDNLVNIELGRVTLTAGQSVIPSNAVDTTHQVLTSVISSAVPMTGDVTGTSSTNRLSFIQGTPVVLTGLAVNNVLGYNGTNWIPFSLPTSLPPNGSAGGDLSGSYPNPTVARSSASTFTVVNNEQVNGSLTVNNTVVGQSTITAVGNLIGANATAINHAVILGQLTASLGTNGTLTIPVLNTLTSTISNVIVQWGTVSIYGSNPNILNNAPIGPYSFNIPFPSNNYNLVTNWISDDSTTGLGPMGTDPIILEYLAPSSNRTEFTLYADANKATGGFVRISGYPNSSQKGLTGFFWLAWGA